MKRNLFSLLAAALTLVNCATDGQATPAQNSDTTKNRVTVAVSTGSISATKVAVSDAGDATATSSGSYTLSWLSDDELCAWDGSTNEKFEVVDAGENLFEGDLVDGVESIYFVHPYTEIADGSFVLDLASQEAKADLAHLSSNTYMISGEVSVSNGNIASATMQHVGAVMDVKINYEQATTAGYTLSKVVISSAGLYNSAVIDITADVEDGEYYSSAVVGDIEVAVDGIEANTDGYYIVPVNILPLTIADQGTVTVTATFVDGDGTQHTASRTVTADSEVIFERGTRNTLIATLDQESQGTTTEPTVWTLNYTDFTTSGSFNTDISYYTIDDIDINVYRVIYSSSTQYMWWNGGQGYIYNTTAMPDISKIEFDITTNTSNVESSFYVWVTTQAGVKGDTSVGKLVATISEVSNQTYTVDNIDPGYDYFYIIAGSTASFTPEVRVTYQGTIGSDGDTSSSGSSTLDTYTYTPNNSEDIFESMDEFTDEFTGGYDSEKWNLMGASSTVSFPTWDFKGENVVANNGELDFTIKYDPRTNRSNGNSSFTYADEVYFSSGMLRSVNKTTYGYYEVRMRGTSLQPNDFIKNVLGLTKDSSITKNMGACPAFWLYSDVSAGRTNVSSDVTTNIYYNEIDVIELNQVAYEPETLSQNLHLMTWENGGYFASADKHEQTGLTETYNCGWDSAEDYHTYACENRPDSIVFYIDEKRVGAKVNSFWHLDDEVGGGMWVTLSLGLRAPFEYYDSSSSRCARATTEAEATASGFPATMSIDYVRAWRRKDNYASFPSNQRDWLGKDVEP